MSPGDLLLSKEAIEAKYAGKGSPDYPSHDGGCICSGCYGSWAEWRGARAGINALKSTPLYELTELQYKRDFESCDYCGCDAGGGLYHSGLEFDHHDDWCPSVIACKAFGLTALRDPDRRPTTDRR
jgi:hypothetical protein